MVGQRLEMHAAIGAASSLKNYTANSSTFVQARGFSNAHCLPGQHAHPSVHRTNGPKGLGQYTTLLMSEDADAHAQESGVARRSRRVQGHTGFTSHLQVGGTPHITQTSDMNRLSDLLGYASEPFASRAR